MTGWKEWISSLWTWMFFSSRWVCFLDQLEVTNLRCSNQDPTARLWQVVYGDQIPPLDLAVMDHFDGTCLNAGVIFVSWLNWRNVQTSKMGCNNMPNSSSFAPLFLKKQIYTYRILYNLIYTFCLGCATTRISRGQGQRQIAVMGLEPRLQGWRVHPSDVMKKRCEAIHQMDAHLSLRPLPEWQDPKFDPCSLQPAVFKRLNDSVFKTFEGWTWPSIQSIYIYMLERPLGSILFRWVLKI